MTAVNDLAMERIEYLVTRAQHFSDLGDTKTMQLLMADAEELATSMDGDEVLTMTYHRYLSDSFGVEFEQTHGDPELMFGGVL